VNLRTRVLILILGIGTVGIAVTLLLLRHAPRESQSAAARPAPPAPVPKITEEKVPVGRGDTFDQLLAHAGIEAPARAQMTASLKSIFDIRKLRAGSELTLTRNAAGVVESLAYDIDPDHRLQLSFAAEACKAEVVEIPGIVRAVPVSGTMRDSLFESLARAGEPAELALEMADIFAWDLDFYTDPQPGDEFRLLVEKKEYANGQPPTFRRILAATYNNAGTVYEGFLFQDTGGKPAYYSADGRSLQAAFLHSPLKFEARISSHFSRRRLHPVMRIYRPHPGTDYAAPIGASVQAIASGRVTFSGPSGASGNMIRIRHANGYESLYLHLSRMFVRVGQQVTQGERIGLVGATGMVTGPHLDFRLRRNGAYVNFERFRPPRATRLTGQQMAAFTADRDRFAALLNSAPAAVVGATAQPEDHAN
jgi:murein DD-endopeptidase MepM/ murein hydrolase activator NlpD